MNQSRILLPSLKQQWIATTTASHRSIIVINKRTLSTASLWRRHFDDNKTNKNCSTSTNRPFTAATASSALGGGSGSSSSSSGGGDRLRVAIVGGGAAGLSSALHLAPLVSQGLILGPIDIFDDGITSKKKKGRKIGVGIWSTALEPFQKSDRDSHQMLVHDLTEMHGTFVRDVGYRSPKGHWLAESRLDDIDTSLPDLLFLREVDLLQSLRKALHLEELRGTVSFHNGRVSTINETSNHPWSAPLVALDDTSSGSDDDKKYISTPRDYHLILAADGIDSTLRTRYGGHLFNRRILTGTSALPSPLDLPSTNANQEESPLDQIGQQEATMKQDREYTVFRGNSNLSMEEAGCSRSFQTWGEGRSMRFATVPMKYRGSSSSSSSKSEERQVWFITTNDEEITSISDPTERREKLLETFEHWHDPICRIVRATRPEDILMERAMAHKHCMPPVTNFKQIVQRVHEHQLHQYQSFQDGNGPVIVFLGDAFMCVDPILAQGFTLGMEGAAALADSLKQLGSGGGTTSTSSSSQNQLAFDPIKLRKEVKERHERRLSRLVCMLRITELVQALGQPTSGTLSGLLSRDILRPLMRITPNFIKTPVFNAVLKYSLGLSSNFQKYQPSTTTTTANEEQDDNDVDNDKEVLAENSNKK